MSWRKNTVGIGGGVCKKSWTKLFFWSKILGFLKKSWESAEEFTDVWSKKVGKWSKIFKKWAAESRWGATTFRVCGQKPKNF